MSTQIQTTQNPNPQEAGGINSVQMSVLVNQVKQMIIGDIKTKLATGEMLLQIFDNFSVSSKDLEKKDVAEMIATLLYKLYNLSADKLDEHAISSFIDAARNREFDITDISVEYDIRRDSKSADIFINLSLPNGYMSSPVAWLNDRFDTASLTKKEYQQYISLVNAVKSFLSNIKELAEDLAKEAQKAEEEEEEEGEE